ncbi:MAG: hypothetical protein B7Z15_11585 [Rhizobiales bacterium 32-66-8]|nr:MAG: hypothetical protein B7Z15_11585 [Rhizobiales bacterium 32-66-8]
MAKRQPKFARSAKSAGRLAPRPGVLSAPSRAPSTHWLTLGRRQIQAGEIESAIASFEAAARAGAVTADGLCGAGIAAYERGADVEALALVTAACRRAPDRAAFHANRGFVLFEMRRLKEAVEAFQQALVADPNHAEAYVNLGSICAEGRRVPEAIHHYRRALAIDPDNIVARYGLAIQRRHACDWQNLETEEAQLTALLERTVARLGPFMRLAAPVLPREHLRAARVWAQGVRVSSADALPAAPAARAGEKIRIGYLSSDFYHHATAFLAVEIFERHDRKRFEITAYSFGPDDGSAMRQRLLGAFDRFVEIGQLDAAQAARRIRADGIDILVDLKGYTHGSRPEIPALRPAPVQVNYLGYPGTMGAPFIDYIIGDRVVTPHDAQALYDERIVQLPGSYQPNDGQRALAQTVPSRADCGLPERGFVFCCFNNAYKITPDIFALWMRLLEAVPDSVLWLFEANATARDNLYYQAGAHGIDPFRIVFAPPAHLPEHLARHVHADLVVDTLHYNAHTTASDALWAGVPVITCMGESFASRVAASLLTAAGLPELVTPSMAEYEASPSLTRWTRRAREQTRRAVRCGSP